MKKVRWGIIGPGRIAHIFAKDIAFTNNAILQAVASRSPERAQEFAAQYNIPVAHGSYHALMSDTSVDAVYIATPHTLHAGQIMQAISNNKSVLCEKPLTVSPAETETVIQYAAHSDVSVMEGLWTYFLPAVQKAKAWVDAGRIGKIVQFKADFGLSLPYDPDDRIYDRRLAGGCLLDMGIYPIALAQLFIKADPLHADVQSGFAPNGVENDLAITFKYEDCDADIKVSSRTKLANTAVIIGEQASIEIPDCWCASECTLSNREEIIDYFSDGRKGSGFEFQIQSFSDDIFKGRKQSSIIPLQTSLTLQEHMALVRDAIMK